MARTYAVRLGGQQGPVAHTRGLYSSAAVTDGGVVGSSSATVTDGLGLRGGVTLSTVSQEGFVTAEHADVILDSYGVNLHQSYVISDADGGVYAQQNYSAIYDLMVDLGIRIYRDVLKTAATSNGARTFYRTAFDTYGMKVSGVMGRRGGAPTYDAQSPTYRADLATWVVDNADVLVQMEGYNEPNHVTSGRPSDWDEQVVDHAQWVMSVSDTIQATHGIFVPAASASLHNVTSTREQDLVDLAALGWASHCHYANIHCYPGANRPSGFDNSNSDISQRTEQHYTLGGFNPLTQPATNTESGYFSTDTPLAAALARVPLDVAANYAPKHVMEWIHLDRLPATPLGCLHQFKYELLDDPNPAGDDRESNLGMVEVPNKTDPNTWTPKPEFYAMKSFLAAMADPGPAYTPNPLRMTVTGATEPSVKWRLYGKRNGTYQLVLWRDNQNVWTEANGYQWPSTVNMTVETDFGSQVVPVGRDLVVHTITP